MNDNNLYIALKAYTEGEYDLASFAFTEITQADLEKIKENVDLVNKSKTAQKICVFWSDFDFVDDDEIAGADRDLFDKIASRVENDNNYRTILSKKEYDLLSFLPTLELNTDELQIYKDSDIRAFASTEHRELITIHTEFFNPFNLINIYA